MVQFSRTLQLNIYFTLIKSNNVFPKRQLPPQLLFSAIYNQSSRKELNYFHSVSPNPHKQKFLKNLSDCFRLSKGQIKPKADSCAVDSPKRQTNEFVLFAFLLFTANKTNSFVHFLGESMARQSCFGFCLTFTELEFNNKLKD